ncbi:hypothetical protein GCM10022420_098680 [Streptomyces iranensis]
MGQKQGVRDENSTLGEILEFSAVNRQSNTEAGPDEARFISDPPQLYIEKLIPVNLGYPYRVSTDTRRK